MSDRPLLLAGWNYSTHVRRFLDVLTASGWQCVFVPFDGGAGPRDERPLPHGASILSWLGTSEPWSLERHDHFVTDLRAVVAEVQPDLILAGPMSTVGSVASFVESPPVVQMSYGSDLLLEAEDAEVSLRLREAIGRSSAVFVDSRAGADAACALGASETDLWVMPWGVDLNEFPVAEWPRGKAELRVISLRSLEEVYDPRTLLAGFAAAVRQSQRPMSLTVAGDGSLAREMRKMARDEGIDRHVTWLGRVSETEVPGLLASHHLHLSAALSDGSSISLLQAFATGRPCVATDIPANREWIDDGITGYLFPAGDVEALSTTLCSCASKEGSLRLLGDAARATVEARGNWPANSAAWVTWLQGLLR